MKNYFFSLLVLLSGCCAGSSAQCPKDCSGCSRKKTTMIPKNDHIKDTLSSKTMTCKLTSPELRKRKEEVIARLKGQVLEKKELPDGYGYKFDGTDDMLDSLAEFIKSERMCCDFFNFRLQIGNDSFIWLEISGEDGTKEFITTELEL